MQVFSPTAPDLRGGSPLPANRVIHWGEFFADIPLVDTDGNIINLSRRVDTLISSSLFVLPIPGAGSGRIERAGLPEHVPSRVLRPAVRTDGGGGAGAAGAQSGDARGRTRFRRRHSAVVLHPVGVGADGRRHTRRAGGSVIIAAGFEAAIKNGDTMTKGRTDGTQLAALRGPDGLMTVSDLFVFAGVASR